MTPTNESTVFDRSRWVKLLDSVCKDRLDTVPFDEDVATRVGYIEDFRDEFGNRRASDRPFLSHMLGVEISALRDPDTMALDEQLWWCVAARSSTDHVLVAEHGGLLVNPDEYAIEYRTMIELCALQAFWSMSSSGGGRLVERAFEAARWNIEELQPDNAINRPWGLVVFVELALSDPDTTAAQSASLYAQTLLHNACINFGKPDLLSAMILHDCVRQLRKRS